MIPRRGLRRTPDRTARSLQLTLVQLRLGHVPLDCRGFGRVMSIDYSLVVPDETKSLAQGAIKPWQSKSYSARGRRMARRCIDPPVADLDRANARC